MAFVLAVTKYLIKSNLGMEGVTLAHSVRGTQFTVARKVWKRMPEMDGHMASSIRRPISDRKWGLSNLNIHPSDPLLFSNLPKQRLRLGTKCSNI